MSRTLTATGLQGILAETTSSVYLFAMVITHDDLVDPLYLIQNNVNLDVDIGTVETFTAFPFDLTLPTTEENSLPTAQIRIDNIDRTLVELIRTTTVKPDIALYIVRFSPGDTEATVEIGPMDFKLQTVSWTAQTVTGTLSVGYDYLNESCIKYRFTPDIAIGLFDLGYESA